VTGAPKRTHYVVGFLFADPTPPFDRRVLLIRKRRPEWQAGRLNGIGGKVEPTDPSFEYAMRREFREEVGVADPGISTVDALRDPPDFTWRHYASLSDARGWAVHFFAAKWTLDGMSTLMPRTDETLWCGPASPGGLTGLAFVPNLLWLIPLALDEDIARAQIFEVPRG